MLQPTSAFAGHLSCCLLQARPLRAPTPHFHSTYPVLLQARLIAEVLEKAKIPYKVFGAKSFWEIAVIRDMLCFLRCENNGH